MCESWIKQRKKTEENATRARFMAYCSLLLHLFASVATISVEINISGALACACCPDERADLQKILAVWCKVWQQELKNARKRDSVSA